MTKEFLNSYQSNKRLAERLKGKIEEEKMREIPVVAGKVKGSMKGFPYIERRFSVQMTEPIEAAVCLKKIQKYQSELILVETRMKKVEDFIDSILDSQIREIFTYRFLDGMTAAEVGKKVGYTHGRVSQIISKYLKD